LLGICGGFQMLGTAIDDPWGLEGAPGSCAGLGWLDMTTTLESEKQLRNVAGRLTWADAAVSGYEIHAGITSGPALEQPFALLDGREAQAEGARSADGQIMGTYLHGLFESSATTAAILRWAGLQESETPDYRALREAEIDRLADAVGKHLDMKTIGLWLGKNW